MRNGLRRYDLKWPRMWGGMFYDEHRGNGWYVARPKWLLAVRWRWSFRFTRPSGKPGYARLYVGPIEIEHRPF